MRGMPLILVALFIDGLQALFSAAFLTLGAALTGVTPIGGAIGGATAGAVICWNSAGGIISGVIDAAKCAKAGGILGAGASAFGIPLGIGLGFVSDICISVTLGAGFLLLLKYNDMFYTKYAFGGGLGELIPGLDILPGWTVMTVLCIIRKSKEEGQLQGSASGAFAQILAPGTVYGEGFRAVKSIQRQKVQASVEYAQNATPEQAQEARAASRQQLKANLTEIDGIRAPATPAPNIPRTRYAA